SAWVQREINEAERFGKPILPLLLEGDIWFRLNDYQSAIVEDGALPTGRFVASVVAGTSLPADVNAPPPNSAAPPAPASPITPGTAPASVPTVIVDAMGRGDFDDLAAAIENARAGSQVLIRRGTYKSAITVGKPLELIGEGLRDDIRVEAS